MSKAAEEELKRVREALRDYPRLPEDVFIGRNEAADKVTWLIRRLTWHEQALRKVRDEQRAKEADRPE
jgi:hypothetical protein